MTLYKNWLIFCGVLAAMFIGYLIGLSKPPVIVPRMMSCPELQRFLVTEGYDIGPNGVDGVCGKDTDTQTAWDAYICDMYAKREFERIE